MTSRPGRYRDVLRVRSFRALMVAFLVDGAASWAFGTVIAVVVFDDTGSTTWVAASFAVRWIPGLVLGPFAGLLGDRFDRGRVMLTSAGTSFVVMAVLAVAVGVAAPVWVVLGLSTLQAIAAVPYNPAAGGVIPDLLPESQLAAANGLRETLDNICVIAGPGVGALFLVIDEPALAVGLNALSYLVPVLVVSRLQLTSRPAPESGDGPRVWRDLANGVRALRARPTALILVLACVFDTALAGLGGVLAVPLSVRLGTGAAGYAYLTVAIALGAVLGSGLAGRLAARRRLTPVIVGSLALQALPYAAVVVLPSPVAAFLLLVVSGVGMIVVDILAVTALQRDLPGEYLSRVFGIFDSLLLAGLVVTGFLGSALAQQFGLTAVLLGMGLGTPLLTLASVPTLRRMDARTAEPTARLEPTVALLHELDLFDGADRAELETLAAAAVAVELGDGDVVMREGDPAEDLFVLVRGRLQIRARDAGDLPDVVAPAYVGEIGLLHHRPRTATVTAAGSVSLLRIPGDRFVEVVTGGRASSSLVAVSGLRLARSHSLTPVGP